jgi:Raf kinase inhibitor-like YbhB/YbcL family protein
VSRFSKTLLIFLITLLWPLLVTGCIGDNNGGQEEMTGPADGLQEDPEADSMMISSSAFENGGQIPVKYTCDGENTNPPIEFENLPEGTKSMVLIVNDPDAPSGSFTHWLVWDILPGSQVNENSVPGTVGKNSFGQVTYGGPCPSLGTHRYHFKVFALDRELNLPGGSGIEQVEESMQGHILAQGQLTGKYGRA